MTIRDLLLTKGHLIPPKLLDDAGRLIEHYDRWLEEFERMRLREDPDLETPFVFAGPAGYGFPHEAERGFQDAFHQYWSELYGSETPVKEKPYEVNKGTAPPT